MGIVGCAHSRAVGLRNPELDGRRRLSNTGILIEGQTAGFDVDEVPGFLRGRLPRSGAGGVGFKIDAHLALSSHNFGDGIVSKV